MIRDSIFSILEKNPKGVSLAILPKVLKKYIPFTLDLCELGFSKLKLLLEAIDYV
jgi:hypothetical protein